MVFAKMILAHSFERKWEPFRHALRLVLLQSSVEKFTSTFPQLPEPHDARSTVHELALVRLYIHVNSHVGLCERLLETMTGAAMHVSYPSTDQGDSKGHSLQYHTRRQTGRQTWHISDPNVCLI